jgi:hypothetical protein
MDKDEFLKQYENYSVEDLRLIRDSQQELYTDEEMLLIESLIARSSEQKTEDGKKHIWLYVLSCLIPLAGFIVSIIFLRSHEPQERKIGRQCLITSIIALLLWAFFNMGGFSALVK